MSSSSDIKRYRRIKKKIAEGTWATLNQAMKLLEQKANWNKNFGEINNE